MGKSAPRPVVLDFAEEPIGEHMDDNSDAEFSSERKNRHPLPHEVAETERELWRHRGRQVLRTSACGDLRGVSDGDVTDVRLKRKGRHRVLMADSASIIGEVMSLEVNGSANDEDESPLASLFDGTCNPEEDEAESIAVALGATEP